MIKQALLKLFKDSAVLKDLLVIESYYTTRIHFNVLYRTN